jgi:5'-phosphate synthase pdxT subunit
MKKVGVLALQGAFIEHEKMLEQLGVSCIELRNKEDLEKPYDGIILPDGESTVQGKLLKELDMFDTIKK